MRKGIKPFDIKQINGITPSTSFLGLTISNSVIAFLAVQWIFGIFLFPLFWPMFWTLVKDKLSVVLLVIISSIVKTILMKICFCLLVAPSFVKHRRLIN